ncbi:hypothetical protein JNUCC42_03565 [Brevibacterium sp. JNUCC-42]|nr:hypothetical protein JNUCC42_03565 [Brevibacterium sp. JNUCC-42]
MKGIIPLHLKRTVLVGVVFAALAYLMGKDLGIGEIGIFTMITAMYFKSFKNRKGRREIKLGNKIP